MNFKNNYKSSKDQQVIEMNALGIDMANNIDEKELRNMIKIAAQEKVPIAKKIQNNEYRSRSTMH